MENNTQVYFIDLDGTLLDSYDSEGHTISKKNIKAIEKAKKEGKKIIISTGRWGKTAEKFLKMIPSEYAVLGNGAVILGPNNEKLRHLKLSVRDNLIALEILKKHKLVLKLDDSYDAYGVKSKMQSFLTRKFGFKPINHYNYELLKEYTKIVAWGTISKSKIAKITEEIKETLPHLSVVNSGQGYTIEITNGEATKGIGNEYVASLLKVDKEHTAHIGDSMNDSTAVGHVGKVIVMSNGVKKLKALSEWRGPSYKNGGVAKILEGDIKKVDIK